MLEEEEETEGFFAWNYRDDQLIRKIRKSEYIKKKRKKLSKERSRQINNSKKFRRNCKK